MIPIDHDLQDFWIKNIWPNLIGNLTKEASDTDNQMHKSTKDEL